MGFGMGFGMKGGEAAAGGLADAADHAGALAGALLTGIFLVPLLGFDGTLLLLAAVKALSALGWWLPASSKPLGSARRIARNVHPGD